MTRFIQDASDSEEPDNTPVIDEIHHLTITTESNVDSFDEFSRPASELKPLDGTDSVFKRKVTREINKVRRGIDGAESKQIEEEADYTGYQMFDVVTPSYNLDYLAKLYEISATHHAAVEAKVANIVGLGYRFVETPKQKHLFERFSDDEKKTKKARLGLEQHRDDLTELLESFNEEDGFTETLMKVWRDYEVMGNGYLEIGRKKDGVTIGYIGHIPAQTMRVRKKRDGFVQISGYKVQYFANFGDSDKNNPLGGGKPNEVIHVKKYSPTNAFYGIPDIISAKTAIAGNEFAGRFNLDYFENKAVPRHLIILKGAKLGAKAESRLLAFFETGLKGQNHRSLFVPLPADTDDLKTDLKIEAIEAGIQDSSFLNYRKTNDNDILMAHRVPITKVSVSASASLAIARDADKTFKEQVCAPEQGAFEKKLNKIIKELSDALQLKLNEMTLTDADTQSKIDERMVKAGIWLANEPRTRDGMPAIPGGNDRVDLNAKDKIAQQQAEATTQRQRDAARSAGATDTAGEARAPKGDGRTVA